MTFITQTNTLRINKLRDLRREVTKKGGYEFTKNEGMYEFTKKERVRVTKKVGYELLKRRVRVTVTS